MIQQIQIHRGGLNLRAWTQGLFTAKNNFNKGVNYSRNFAISQIVNMDDYVIFLDDDDWLSDMGLLELSRLLQANPHDWVVAKIKELQSLVCQMESFLIPMIMCWVINWLAMWCILSVGGLLLGLGCFQLY